MAENIEYKGFIITVEEGTDRVFVYSPELFNGALYHPTLDEAKDYIDYVIKNSHKWI